MRRLAAFPLLAFGAMSCASGCDAPARGDVPPRVAALPEHGSETPLALEEPAESKAEPLRSDARIDWEANPVMKTLGRVSRTMVSTRYSHQLQIDESRGTYAFDCSTMVSWVLRKATPSAAAALEGKFGRHPLARDFHDFIASVPAEGSRKAWRRIARVADAEPGDVVAWIKPAIVQSPYTGHVAVVVRKPVRLSGDLNAFLVRIADSTSLLHQDDTREGRSGFGLGTILLMANETGNPTGYGWVGTAWRSFETPVAIGRPMR